MPAATISRGAAIQVEGRCQIGLFELRMSRPLVIGEGIAVDCKAKGYAARCEQWAIDGWC